VAASDKKRVVIVGGGPSALAAAFELTSGELAERHEVTLLQPGWRLGGKCASGRGANERIEEHGLHVWFGSYDNAFALMRRCYEELGRDPARYAFTSVGSAFDGLTEAILWQHDAGDWSPHELSFPRTPSRPDDAVGAIGSVLRELASGLTNLEREGVAPDGSVPFAEELHVEEPGIAGSAEVAVRLLEHHVNEVTAGLHSPLEDFSDLARLIEVSEHLSRRLDLLGPEALESADVRFRRETILLVLTITRGILRDGLLFEGFDSINDVDFGAWLRRHGGNLGDDPTDWPVIVRAIYDGCFAFAGGNPAKPTIAAGRALQGLVRCLLHYRGTVIARMRGGMGDTVIAPFYEVLVRRGVDIRFFHAVKELHTDGAGRSVTSIDVVRQVELTGEYVPLRDVTFGPPGSQRSVPSWSADPPRTIIRDAHRLGHDLGERLEHEIDPFGGKALTLHAGKDFDVVVLAVPPDVQREICKPLRPASADYARMLDTATTVATQAAQMWLDQPIEDLGETRFVDAFVSCYVEPIDTYSAMTHLLECEHWPPDDGIKHIAYFCGVLADEDVQREAAAAHRPPDPARRGSATAPAVPPGTSQRAAGDVARVQLDRFRQHHLHTLWSGVSPPADDPVGDGPVGGPHHPANSPPPAARHYVRANWAPTERYVLTPPGTVEHRLWPGQSGLDNLVLAGDWTRNGLDVGCVEAAMTSGMLASNAICGSPRLDDVKGLNGPPGFPNRFGGDGPPGAADEDDPIVAAAEWAAAPIRLALAASRSSLQLACGAARRFGRALIGSARP
jgi:uncharacterized protein with NAD-binding domain and iron-sulfur cluster